MRDVTTFLLNGEVQRYRGDPTRTLLQHLREDRRLKGTKEGCAEGDCGACTVVLGRLDNNRLGHSAANACILFVPMLEGQSVTTVEGLAGPDGVLHPCQQAMVDCHGSQCGFCTPGFVMSLYALHQSGQRLDGAEVDEVLAGNLCRCTGYGPIVASAAAMLASAPPAWMVARRDAETAALHAIAHDEPVVLASPQGEFHAPASLAELASLVLDRPDATLVAGATDVGLWVTKQHRALPLLIQVGRVPELRAIGVADGRLTLGAGVTYAEALPHIDRHFPSFGRMMRRIGGTQVRKLGTLGGNIANGSPIGDSLPALIALGATLVLRRGKDQRRLPLEAYFLDYRKQDRRPGELVERIEVPLLRPGDELSCYKISKRFDQDISAVCGSFNIAVREGRVAAARIAFGGMAATPKRALAVEAALIGRPWSRATAEAAGAAMGDDFTPIDDMRASAAYRLQVARNLLLRAYLERSGGAAPVSLDAVAAAAE
jgi:xanthine dehydrogenase small subunit